MSESADLIAEYRSAYAAANPGDRGYSIEYRAGWYRFAKGGVVAKYRRTDVEQMIRVLRSRVAAQA